MDLSISNIKSVDIWVKKPKVRIHDIVTGCN